MNSLNFIIDKRTALISIILAFSEGNEYIEEHFPLSLDEEYTHSTLNYFEPYKNHKSVSLAKRLGKNESGFNFDNPIRLAFELTEDLKYNGTLSPYLLTELEEIDLIKEFLCEVENFAIDTNFELFYNKNYLFYQSLLAEINKIINEKKLLACFNSFFKNPLNTNFCVNIIPSLINANHGFKINNTIYANIGLPCENFKTVKNFDNGYLHIVIHEFLHSFVNCHTKKLINNIKFKLPESKKSNLVKIVYNNMYSYINDCIVRALSILIRKNLSNIDDSTFLQREKDWGFIHIERVYNQLIKYEKQNQLWEEYFINILKCFEFQPADC